MDYPIEAGHVVNMDMGAIYFLSRKLRSIQAANS